jgi:hypothetical protein
MEVTFTPLILSPASVSSPGLAIQMRTRTTETEMDRDKGKEMSCSSHIFSSLSILNDAHGPRTTNIKSIGNLNDMWPIIGATFLSQPLDVPSKTKPLSLYKLLTVFSFKSCFWDGWFSYCRHSFSVCLSFQLLHFPFTYSKTLNLLMNKISVQHWQKSKL